jgi:magnesium transporter
MLQAILINDEGQEVRGGEELLQQWQQSPSSRIWVDLDNLDEKTEDRVMALFGLHPLAIIDARRSRHPPKLEVFDDHLFILLRGLDADTRALEFGTIQLALFASERYLLTRRTRNSRSVAHWKQSPELASYLSFSGIKLALGISNSAAMRYLEMLLEFEPRLTELEDQLQEKPDDSTMRELTHYRTRLRKLRRNFNYHCRLFENLREVETEFFSATDKQVAHLLIDVYERWERLLSLSSMYYELAGDLVDGYISLSSHELNNTMRILTVLTAIFVPLGFLAGLYGMNFDYMPELHWKGGYFVLLSVMVTIIISLLAVFKYKRWL